VGAVTKPASATASGRQTPTDAVPAAVLVIGAIASVQFGASFAKSLFDDLGPGGTAMLRIGFAAVILMALWRPPLRGRSRSDWTLMIAFGVALGGMNLSFYEALDRIPLGVGVTLEFVGPLAVAVVGSGRPRDLIWVALAAAGILTLTDLGGGSLDTTGVLLALLAGTFWAFYIYIAQRAGQVFPGGGGLAIAMTVAAVLVIPAGISQGGSDLLEPGLLAAGFAVAVLSSAIPYSLELEALRRLPKRVFGVMMSLEPAMAALAGFIVLGEVLHARELTGIALVVAASAGAARGSSGPPATD
jgi:inner membrane transporter RhtA